MIKFWFKRDKRKLIFSAGVYSGNNTRVSMNLTTYSGLGYHSKVSTSDGYTNISSNVVSIGGLPSNSRTYTVEFAANLSPNAFKSLSIYIGLYSQISFTKSFFEFFPKLQSIDIQSTARGTGENLTGIYSSENYATLNLPYLKNLTIVDSSTSSNKWVWDFNTPNLLPSLQLLSMGIQFNRITVKGEVKYLPRSLKSINDRGFGSPSGFIGKLSDFPDNINTIYLKFTSGNNISGYTSKNWTGVLTHIMLQKVTLTSSELDSFLIDLANATWGQATGKEIYLSQRVAGSIGVRTSASNNAVNILKAQGITLQVSNNTF